MLYTELEIGNKKYKLRLGAKESVMLEKALKCNPLSIFIQMEEGKFPTLEDILKIFHASLQKYQHDIDMDNTYDLYDKYIDNGGNMIDLVAKLSEVISNAGYVPKTNDTEEESPNA